jgi:anti-anti-sigma regulatory factor
MDTCSVAVRPGEHACCRFPHAADRERLALAFARCGLARGDKVIYLVDREHLHQCRAELVEGCVEIADALDRGQFGLRHARAEYNPEGMFEIGRMLEWVAAEHARALAEGYPGLHFVGDMAWALHKTHGTDQVANYERALDAARASGTLAILCQYDHGRFAISTLTEMADIHEVDIGPELAAIGRDGGTVAAATVGHGPHRTVRLCGELDFGCSHSLAIALDASFHGTLCLDLTDLDFVDVTGMRALRGRAGRRLKIVGASDTVRRLHALLAWDTDPAIEFAAPA